MAEKEKPNAIGRLRGEGRPAAEAGWVAKWEKGM